MGRKSRRRREVRQNSVAAGVPARPGPASAKAPTLPNFAILALLAVLTLAVFGQVTSHSFLNYDDAQFIYENAHVKAGLTPPSIGWALTSTSIGWYPLTWLSHMVDIDLWDLRVGMHLLTNVLLHLFSACILFLALQRMTADQWRSAIVAALFVIHPTHVESVAWASERKDTLSTLFAVIALLLYAVSPRRRLLLFVAMAFSLMAKQMYITLPFVLLLLDFWPLRRLQSARNLRDCAIEKAPLFALTIFGAVMAVIGQRNLSAVQSMAAVPLGTRLANAVVAYVRYIGKMFLPVDLAVLYPLQPAAATAVIAATILLIALSIAAFRFRNSAPWFLTGWFWFLGTLVPVIGIVQIGTQSIADRYTYFPYIGLFIAVVWGASALARRAMMPESIQAATAAIIIIALAATAYRQVGFWRDSETLFTHTIAVTPPNALAEYSLGQTLELTDPDRSATHLRRAIELVERVPGSRRDWHAQAYVGLGTALLMKARPMPAGPQRTAIINEAVAYYQRALTIDPNAPHAKNNIALARQWLGSR